MLVLIMFQVIIGTGTNTGTGTDAGTDVGTNDDTGIKTYTGTNTDTCTGTGLPILSAFHPEIVHLITFQLKEILFS